MRERSPYMLQGTRIRLRAFEPQDLEADFTFVNDEETALMMYKGMPYPSSRSDESQWLSQQSSYTRGEYQFAIDNLEGCLVGRIGIIHMDWKNRCAELAMMIGPAYRRRGYGREALRLVREFCFRQLNCHRLKVSVLDFNEPAIRLYLDAGFVHEGRLREEVFRNGAYCDVIVMGCLNPAEA